MLLETNLSQEMPDWEMKILRLSRSKFMDKSVSAGSLRNLLHVFNSIDDTFNYLERFFIRHKSEITSEEEIRKEIAKANSINAKIITYKNKLYPKLLRLIPDYPLVLTYIGNIELLNKKTIAVVGSRNASIMGQSFATRIASELAAHDISVVSGLAKGIDAAAHKGAINSTVAVLGGGVDHIYPPENDKLYHKIIEKNSLIIIENKIGARPSAIDFRARNRIIAGVSLGTCVVEAARASGSLVTAKFATEYNRDVFAVPGQPMDPRSTGTNGLILNGAYMVSDAEDIMKNLSNIDIVLNNNKNMVVNEPYGKVDLSKIEAGFYKAVLNMLNINPTSIETLHHYTGLDLRVLHIILLELELTNKIKRHEGGHFSINRYADFDE